MVCPYRLGPVDGILHHWRLGCPQRAWTPNKSSLLATARGQSRAHNRRRQRGRWRARQTTHTPPASANPSTAQTGCCCAPLAGAQQSQPRGTDQPRRWLSRNPAGGRQTAPQEAGQSAPTPARQRPGQDSPQPQRRRDLNRTPRPAGRAHTNRQQTDSDPPRAEEERQGGCHRHPLCDPPVV